MRRVTGLGGIFFKSSNPERLYQWYEKHLGITREPHGQGSAFHWRNVDDPEQKSLTAWSIFPKDTKYFGASGADCMINYLVENLDELLATLKAEGVEVDPHREDYDYGRFAWITDADGNRIELWEPPK